MSTVGATIVVDFGSGADSSAFVVVELDETLNLDASGNARSEFSPGDEVWFWVQHDAVLRIGEIECTSGMVVDCGSASRWRGQDLTWTSDDSIELSHIPSVMPDLTWYGNVGQGLALSGRTITVTGGTPCTCDALIPIEVRLFRFVPPQLDLTGDQTWRVVVVVTMEAA